MIENEISRQVYNWNRVASVSRQSDCTVLTMLITCIQLAYLIYPFQTSSDPS